MAHPGFISWQGVIQILIAIIEFLIVLLGEMHGIVAKPNEPSIQHHDCTFMQSVDSQLNR